MRAQENEMRRAYAAGTSGALDAHHGLVNIFTDTTNSLVFSPDPRALPTVARLRPAGEQGVRVSVRTLDAFRRRGGGSNRGLLPSSARVC
eukprot:3223628-Prymnesium_polylepis.1